MPALQDSAAKTILFMFNTFEPLDPQREAVGPSRFAFGFPAGLFALLIDGKLTPQIRSGTTVTDAAWAKLFTAAGIPTVVDDDMHSWLRSHAALVIPLMSIAMVNVRRGTGITWSEARIYARAMRRAFGVVRELGNSVRPGMVAAVSRLPSVLGDPDPVADEPHQDIARSRPARPRGGSHAHRPDGRGLPPWGGAAAEHPALETRL